MQRGRLRNSMPNQEDKRRLVELEQINEDLSESLERCRFLLKACRAKLAANGNDSEQDDEDDRTQLA